jgi:hypothetical protein
MADQNPPVLYYLIKQSNSDDARKLVQAASKSTVFNNDQ